MIDVLNRWKSEKRLRCEDNVSSEMNSSTNQSVKRPRNVAMKSILKHEEVFSEQPAKERNHDKSSNKQLNSITIDLNKNDEMTGFKLTTSMRVEIDELQTIQRKTTPYTNADLIYRTQPLNLCMDPFQDVFYRKESLVRARLSAENDSDVQVFESNNSKNVFERRIVNIPAGKGATNNFNQLLYGVVECSEQFVLQMRGINKMVRSAADVLTKSTEIPTSYYMEQKVYETLFQMLSVADDEKDAIKILLVLNFLVAKCSSLQRSQIAVHAEICLPRLLSLIESSTDSCVMESSLWLLSRMTQCGGERMRKVAWEAVLLTTQYILTHPVNILGAEIFYCLTIGCDVLFPPPPPVPVETDSPALSVSPHSPVEVTLSSDALTALHCGVLVNSDNRDAQVKALDYIRELLMCQGHTAVPLLIAHGISVGLTKCLSQRSGQLVTVLTAMAKIVSLCTSDQLQCFAQCRIVPQLVSLVVRSDAQAREHVIASLEVFSAGCARARDELLIAGGFLDEVNKIPLERLNVTLVLSLRRILTTLSANLDPGAVTTADLYARMQTMIHALQLASPTVVTIQMNCDALRRAQLKDQKDKFHAMLGITKQMKLDGLGSIAVLLDERAMDCFVALLQENERRMNEHVVENVLIVYANMLTQGSPRQLREVLATDLTAQLLWLIQQNQSFIAQYKTLGVIKILALNGEEQRQVLLRSGILQTLFNVFETRKDSRVLKEAHSLFSILAESGLFQMARNIEETQHMLIDLRHLMHSPCGGVLAADICLALLHTVMSQDASVLQAVHDTDKLLWSMVQVIAASKSLEVQSRAVGALLCLIDGGTEAHRHNLKSLGTVRALNVLLRECPDSDVTDTARTCLSRLLVANANNAVETPAPVPSTVTRVAKTASLVETVRAVALLLNDNSLCPLAQHALLNIVVGDAPHIIDAIFRDESVMHILMTIFCVTTTASPSLSALCHLTAGSADHVETLLSKHLLLHCKTLLTYHSSAEAVTDTCRCVANVCGMGTVSAVQAVVDSGLVPLLVDVMVNSIPVDAATARFYPVLYLMQAADLPQTAYLIDCNTLPAIVSILFFGDCRNLALEALITLHALLTRRFEFASDFHHVCDALEACGGWVRLEQFKQSGDKVFVQWAERLLECRGRTQQVQVVEF